VDKCNSHIIKDGRVEWCEINLHFFILIYIQQDATLYSLFYLKTALHVSGGNSIHRQERKQLYLQHLVFVTPLLLPAAFVEELELFCRAVPTLPRKQKVAVTV